MMVLSKTRMLVASAADFSHLRAIFLQRLEKSATVRKVWTGDTMHSPKARHRTVARIAMIALVASSGFFLLEVREFAT